MVRLLGSLAMPDEKQTEGQTNFLPWSHAGNSPPCGILTSQLCGHTPIHRNSVAFEQVRDLPIAWTCSISLQAPLIVPSATSTHPRRLFRPPSTSPRLAVSPGW